MRPYVVMVGDEASASFAFVLEAKRKTGYYFWKIILPLLLVVAMSWVVFWIDPGEYDTQIGVSTASLLTLIAYRFMVVNELPNISYLTRMDYCMLGTTLLVFIALVQAVMTARLAGSKRIEVAQRIDLWCRVIFPALLAGLFLLVFGF